MVFPNAGGNGRQHVFFFLWPPTMGGHSGRPPWEYQESRIKSQRVESRESQKSKGQRVKSQRAKSQRVKESIVKSQRVNKSPLIGVTRWDNFFHSTWRFRIWGLFGLISSKLPFFTDFPTDSDPTWRWRIRVRFGYDEACLFLNKTFVFSEFPYHLP